ncbi:phosphoribosyltransferase family protein [Chelativorans sp. Marseille-P2723]|uniref:ComF family protein n=1 Tax=Chelativorans sp. Marseille-P2723 TaxID=2709133 RepID=UPI00156E0882|nr:phosphoribosyltransferase family protein [Chelativorans sp. Marseille-P2723]
MGLNISATKFVAFDDTHQRRVDTSLNNPTSETVGGIAVRHIFRRNKTGDKDRDGNPLIYALKGMHGYQIMPMYRKQFMNRARQIIESFAEELEADYIMPLPSSYDFCREVAELICEITEKEYLDPNFIRKRTVQEMLDQYGLEVPNGLNSRAKISYKAQLASWRRAKPAQYVSMKEIVNPIRHCFNPLTLNGPVPDIVGKRLIIVDDLMSTGASLTSAVNVLTEAGCTVTSGVCFVSGL